MIGAGPRPGACWACRASSWSASATIPPPTILTAAPSEDPALRTFHSTLVTQANAYMNATWAIAVAKAGNEDGSGLIGGSCIVDPNGRIVAEAQTLADEVIVADLDLDLCRQGKDKMFNFAAASSAGAIHGDHRARGRRRAGRARCG